MSTPTPSSRRTTKKSNRLALAALVASGVALGASGAKLTWPTAQAADMWQTQTTPPAAITRDVNIDALNKAFTNLADHVSPAVVNVYVTSKASAAPPRMRRFQQLPPGFGGGDDFYFGNPFDSQPQRPGPAPRGQQAQALGSGFVINTDGYIVTNAHVVRMAGEAQEAGAQPMAVDVMVKFAGESEASKGHAAKIVGVDEATDVALLKLVEKKADLKVVPLADSDKSKVGEWVVAIGNPYGHSNSLTQGIVSALGRNLEGARPDFIQTSASINPGNSGGPLINLAGEVIGINTAIDPRAQNIGFAIPINTAKNVITQLMSTGKVTRGWMGIGIQDLNDEIAGYMKLKNQDGVLVKQVMQGQPASRAGIEPYDVITRINGQEIHNTRDLYRQVDRLNVGKSADIEVLRNNETRKLKVEIGEQPSNKS